MNDYNASNTRHIREAKKRSAQSEADRRLVITQIMSTVNGRAYFHERLVRSHVFETSFSSDSLLTAFAEGERNIGLQDFIDIVRYCPDQYIQMMREYIDREVADARRVSSAAADRREQNNGWDDSGSGDELVERDDSANGDARDEWR